MQDIAFLSNWFAAAAQHGEPDCCRGGESKGKKGRGTGQQ